MTATTAYVVFAVGLVAITLGSVWLARGLNDIGARFRMLPGLLGLVAALGSDSPEIFSAITALTANAHSVGLGVVLGSNLFNLAALMGLSGLVAGRLPLRAPVVLFNGAVSLLVTAVALLLVVHGLPPAVGLGLLLVVLGVYVFLLWARGSRIRHLPLPGEIRRALVALVEDVHGHARAGGGNAPLWPGWLTAGVIAGSLVIIVAGSVGMVHSALALSRVWALPEALMGVLILAALTGLPNIYTSVRLALAGEGAAVVSETLNSNTINIVVGLGLPAVVFGVTETTVGLVEIWWLLGMTAAAVGLAAACRGLNRPVGALIIALYAAFVGVRLML